MRSPLLLIALGAVPFASPARAQFQHVPARGTYATAQVLQGKLNAGATLAHRFGRFVDATVMAQYFDRPGAVDAGVRLGATVPFEKAWAVRAEAGARRVTSGRPGVPWQRGLDASFGVLRRVPLSEVVAAYPSLDVRTWYGFDYGATIPVVVNVSKRVAAGVTTRVGINSPTAITFAVQTRLR